LLGVVGAIAIAEARVHSWRLPQIVAALLFVAAPLLDTWPGRKWQAAAARVPAPLSGLVNLHSVLVLLALVVGGRALLRTRPSRLCSAAAALLIAGGLFGALANGSTTAASDAWMAFVVPIAGGFVAARYAADVRRAWSFLGLASLAIVVPVVVGIGAYLLSFGVPTSGRDLVVAKLALFQPHLFQDVTFGNVDHFGNVALLLLPPATLGAGVSVLSRRLRVASAIAAIGLTIIVVFVLSRAVLFVGIAELLGVLLVLTRRATWRPVALPIVTLAALALVFVSPSVRASFGMLVGSETPIAAHGPGKPAGAGAHVGRILDPSEQMRASAISTGLRIARHHLPFGIGSGRYPAIDPVHTAPHSLFVQVLAEDGVLGALGFVFLIVAVALESGRLLVRPDPDDAVFLLRVACAAGAAGILVDGIVAGVPLALGQLNVWPVLLWLQVGLLVGARAANA
jgi:hypothetical protein